MVMVEANPFFEVFTRIFEVPIMIRYIAPTIDSTVIQVGTKAHSIEQNYFRPLWFGLNPTNSREEVYSSFIFQIQNFLSNIFWRYQLINVVSDNFSGKVPAKYEHHLFSGRVANFTLISGAEGLLNA